MLTGDWQGFNQLRDLVEDKYGYQMLQGQFGQVLDMITGRGQAETSPAGWRTPGQGQRKQQKSKRGKTR